MLNALIYHIASGHAFFSGIASIHLAAILSFGSPNRVRSLARTISALLGLLLIAFSATPLPVWFYLIAVIVTLVGSRGGPPAWTTPRSP